MNTKEKLSAKQFRIEIDHLHLSQVDLRDKLEKVTRVVQSMSDILSDFQQALTTHTFDTHELDTDE